MGDKGGKKSRSKAQKQKEVKRDQVSKKKKDDQAKRAPAAPA
ncbi:MAG: hypothetical protein ACOCU4_05675 [Alkalispirochaeta sp.]